MAERLKPRELEKAVAKVFPQDLFSLSETKERFHGFLGFLQTLQEKNCNLTFEPGKMCLMWETPDQEPFLEVSFQKQDEQTIVLIVSPDICSVAGGVVTGLQVFSHRNRYLKPFLSIYLHDPKSDDHHTLFVHEDGMVEHENPENFDYLGRRRSS